VIFSEDKKELFTAIAKAQGEFTTVEKNAENPHFRSKFAPLDTIIEMIRPVLAKHGLSVMQHCDIPESGAGIIIETMITHESGQHISSRLFMPVVKSDPQGYGSSISYGRRYSLAAALGIVSDEDVDGNQGKDEKKTPPPKSAPKTDAGGQKTPTTDAEYQARIKNKLQELYGDDQDKKKAALMKMAEYTDKATGEVKQGRYDYPKMSGDPLKWLCHKIEALKVEREPGADDE